MEKNKCLSCGNKFSRLDNLKRHQKNVCKSAIKCTDAEGDDSSSTTETVGNKRKHLPDSFIDAIINGTTKEERIGDGIDPEDSEGEEMDEHESSDEHGDGIDPEDSKDKEMDEHESSDEHGDGIDLEDSESVEEMMVEKINDTLEYLIRTDRRQIEELLTGFEKDEDVFEDDIVKLRQLTESWIEDEVLGENPTLQDIKNLLNKLSNSEKLKKHDLWRFGVILKDINTNRDRVNTILRQMIPVLIQKDVKPKYVWERLKSLESHRLISREQFEALEKDVDQMTIDNLISEVKSMKIGRGLTFLSTTIDGLHSKLKEWTMDLMKRTSFTLHCRIFNLLDELLSRKNITREDYETRVTALNDLSY